MLVLVHGPISGVTLISAISAALVGSDFQVLLGKVTCHEIKTQNVMLV
jgi:hypothetical protein